jgi:predicted transcriptional regulator
MGHGIPLLRGLASADTSARPVGLWFKSVSLALTRLADDRRLLLDVVVAPASAGPHERSRAVTRAVRDVLWRQESHRCRSRKKV